MRVRSVLPNWLTVVRGLGAYCLLGGYLCCARQASADPASTPMTTFGSAGLIEMPSARMLPDGMLSMSADFSENTQRYSFGFQALPWLETSFRYSGVAHFDAAYPVYWDRSFAAKIRLVQESDLLPAIAVGANDLVGTGIYSGEYLVASKRFGSVDATLGIGWGRLGSTALFKNPLTLISSSFATRPEFGAAGGTNFNSLFHGPSSGLFGGLVWDTPVEGLSLISEYSSDIYSLENKNGAFTPKSQINLGLSYQWSDTFNAGIDWIYGNTVSAHLSFLINPWNSPTQRLGSPPSEPKIRTAEEQNGALNKLLAQRDSREASPASGGISQASRFIDAIWQANSNVADVQIQGTGLSVAISRGDPAALCQAVAQLAGRFQMRLVSVRISSGSQTSTCPVTAALPQNIVFSDNQAAPFPSTAMTQTDALTVIDARPAPVPDLRAATAQIRSDAARQSLGIEAIALGDGEATVYYSNISYNSETEALDRLIRILMSDTPPEIEKFRLIAVVADMPVREFDMLRQPAERSFLQEGDLSFDINLHAADAPMSNPLLARADRTAFPRFSWSIYPQFRQQLFDPNNPFGVQFVAAADATLNIRPGLFITGEVEASLFDTFATSRPSNSLLPHVRTDYLKYFVGGKNGMGELMAGYQFRPARDVYAVVKGGYLESMFAGVGGEVLWRPENDRWALGLDIYDVQQRAYDRLFGLLPYKAVTGHLSLYYASPWYGLNFALRAGQYLAGDRGITFELTRRFASGVEVGAFFTKTNVSAQQFGEGSFDKGLMIRIPLDWVIPINTQDGFSMDLRPVQRDGGQRLMGDATLYDLTRRVSDVRNSGLLPY